MPEETRMLTSAFRLGRRTSVMSAHLLGVAHLLRET